MPLLRPIIGIVFFFGLFMIVMLGLAVGLSGFSSDKGETIHSDDTTSGSASDPGNIAESIPGPLADIFKQPALSGIPAPAALLAAVSWQECSALWKVSVAQLEVWIQSNQNVDQRGCANANGAGARGPMQFLTSTFNSLQGRVSDKTGHRPPSITNIRDSVFAAALYLHDSSASGEGASGLAKPGSADSWTDTHAKNALGHYAGRCTGRHLGRLVRYCDEVIANWKKFSSPLSN